MSTHQTASPDPSARSQEFVPVQGGGETTSAEAILVTAYLVMWALLIAFVALGWRRQARVEVRLAELEKAVGVSDATVVGAGAASTNATTAEARRS